jgi:DNA-binding transcriptional ArsR family regulator
MDVTATVEVSSAAACLFNGLSDPTRMAIIGLLVEGEQRVVDLTQRLGLAQSTVSSHLACLRECHLVEGRPQGRAVLYRLAHPDQTHRLLVAAEHLLAETGEAVALCSTYGLPARDLA